VSEKRKDRRAPSNFEVEYRFDNEDASRTCVAIDISQSGIFLNLKPAPPLETRLFLMFSLPGFTKLGPLKVIGHVVRIVPQGEGQAPGVGVIFDIIYADNRDAVKAFIRSILGPTLVARPSSIPVKQKPGVQYKLTFEGAVPSVEETEADTEEDRRQLKRFNSFTRGGPRQPHGGWLKYGLIGGAVVLAVLLAWLFLR
jgi:hypothetical protein